MLSHKPVLAKEVVEHLVLGVGGRYVDATLGLGGHTTAILEKDPSATVLGIEIDEDMLTAAKANLEQFGKKAILKLGNYQEIVSFASEVFGQNVDGILLDLGLCSAQLNNPERGFSFRYSGPLDMRFNLKAELSAYEIINSFSAEGLQNLFREFGEENRSGIFAEAIVAARKKREIRTTTELVDVLIRHIPSRRRVDVLSRLFQALRIAVNNELENLEKFMNEAIMVLGQGGRLAIISYHSLEDRMVKNFSRRTPLLRSVNKKVIKASRAEILLNPRSRSAKLRVMEKTA